MPTVVFPPSMVLILMTMKIAPENMDWQTRQGVGDRNKGWEMRSEQRFCASASAYSAVSTVSTVNFCELGKGFFASAFNSAHRRSFYK